MDHNSEKNPKKSPINGQPVPSNPNGRPKGTPNKRTIMAREAIAQFVDGNAERLTGWLDKVAEDKPEEAFKLFMSVVEYHIPKLARQEVVGDPEKPLVLRHDDSLKQRLLAEIAEDRLQEILSELQNGS